MLFVAPEFLLIFLPLSLLGYWLLERCAGGRWAMGGLLIASLIFYGWSGWNLLALFIGSLCVNFVMGKWIAKSPSTWPLTFAIGLNLALLVLFKYADFGISVFSRLTGWELPALHWRLPLAISFYTFQQIAYLVQCRRARLAEIPWNDYALAVAFFPHLIAGPLIHYRNLVAQFHSSKQSRVVSAHLHEALNLFIIGLAKKCLIADNLSSIVGSTFNQAKHGSEMLTSEAWLGALAYTFQIYFDFSAYSEMAMGLALMFGLRLPVNFRRPYAAVDLRDFWRRWHITLSEFLRDYLYIPLGGNRRGPFRRWLNLFLTMLLGGLWHGAGWTFIAWGGLHGLFLAINHAWAGWSTFRLPRKAARALTFLVVVLLWVPFRAEDWNSTVRLWTAMAGIPIPASQLPMATEASSTAAAPAQTQLSYVLDRLATAHAGKVDGWIWSALNDAALMQWCWVAFAAFLVFASRCNVDQATSKSAKSFQRALWLGLLLFLIAARNFHAPPGEFLYFNF